jgi:lipopolysaccharide export system permease protein
MRILGVSTLDIIRSLSSAVLLLGIFYITVLDRISVFSSENISSIDANLKQNSRKKDNNFLTVTNNGIWFRDIYKQNSYIMYAKSLNTKSQSLCDVRFFEFDENNELKLSVCSKTATISNGQWILYNANVTDIYNDVERTSIQISFPTHLRFSYINKMVKHPTKISFWSIRKYVAIIEKAGLSSTKYITNWFSRLSIPFQMFAFTIFATTLCIDYNAKNPKKYAIKTAILLTTFFPVYLFNNILTTLAENSDVPINIFSFIIPIFITSVSCILLSFARRK